MMRVVAAGLVLAVLSSVAEFQGVAQNQVGVAGSNTTTQAPCSPIFVGTGGGVVNNINCNLELTPAQLDKIVAATQRGLDTQTAGQVEHLSARLGITQAALETFFKTLGERQVPAEDLDAKLRELAVRYLRSAQVLAAVGSSDSGIQSLRTALERGDLDRIADAVHSLEERLTSQARGVATDRVVARSSIRELADQVRRRGIRAGGVLVNDKRWPMGSTLRFCFLDGAASDRQFVATVAREWSLYANLDLDFGLSDLPRDCSTQAVDRDLIRITTEGQGNWAYIGTDSRTVGQRTKDQPQVSLALKWMQGLDPAEKKRVVLHEFGHVVGFVHAFSNPKSRCIEQIDWDRAGEWGAARGYSRETLRFDLSPSNPEQVSAGDVDPESVMTYALPAKIFKPGADPACVQSPGTGLSLGDKLAALEAYP